MLDQLVFKVIIKNTNNLFYQIKINKIIQKKLIK